MPDQLKIPEKDHTSVTSPVIAVFIQVEGNFVYIVLFHEKARPARIAAQAATLILIHFH